jgi:thiosulfate/3-mercaptopyruvate sulfurtransferase
MVNFDTITYLHQMKDNLKYNYKEFLAFILLYVSHVDLEFSDEEKEKIKKMLPEEDYNLVYEDFMNMNDFQALQTILSYKGVYYPTPEQKAEIEEKLKVQLFADGHIDTMEQEILHFLDKLM